MASLVGKISPVKANPDQYPRNTVKGSLAKEGKTRFPKTKNFKFPFKEIDNSYRTGLDENAAYIKRLPPQEQEQERAKVRGLLEMAQQMYGSNIDLGPRSPFWTDMVSRWGNEDVAPVASLIDGDNIFDLSHPQQLITYAYLRVHPTVAPSGSALMSGRYSKAEFYVNDYDVETAVAYKTKTKIINAMAALSKLTPTKMKQVARQVGIAVSDSTSEEGVLVLLTNYIEASNTAKTQNNVDLFLNFVNMKNELLLIRDSIEQAYTHGVIRKSKNGFYRGEEKLGATKEDVVNYLTDPKNQEDLLAIQEEVKMKKSIRG